MMYSLDTNIIIRLLRNEETVNKSFDNAVEVKAEIAISPFVDYEVWRGFYYSSAPSKEQLYRTLCERYFVNWSKSLFPISILRILVDPGELQKCCTS